MTDRLSANQLEAILDTALITRRPDLLEEFQKAAQEQIEQNAYSSDIEAPHRNAEIATMMLQLLAGIAKDWYGLHEATRAILDDPDNGQEIYWAWKMQTDLTKAAHQILLSKEI